MKIVGGFATEQGTRVRPTQPLSNSASANQDPTVRGRPRRSAAAKAPIIVPTVPGSQQDR